MSQSYSLNSDGTVEITETNSVVYNMSMADLVAEKAAVDAEIVRLGTVSTELQDAIDFLTP